MKLGGLSLPLQKSGVSLPVSSVVDSLPAVIAVRNPPHDGIGEKYKNQADPESDYRDDADPHSDGAAFSASRRPPLLNRFAAAVRTRRKKLRGHDFHINRSNKRISTGKFTIP